jgi:hypothetical protein
MPDEKGKEESQGQDNKTFTQIDLDRIVQDRLARERGKFGDYDELKKFKEEHQKEQDKTQQQELIKQKKFEEAEKKYQEQLTGLQGIVSEKDRKIQDITISNSLIGEVTRQNGMVEEAVALLKSNVMLTPEGFIKVKSTDVNGIAIELTLEEGVKKFLSTRPYLVKANTSKGNGNTDSSKGGGDSGASDQGEDLTTLNDKYWQALQSGNRKLAEETKKKMVPLMKGNRNAL